jgi:hypothetical protein
MHPQHNVRLAVGLLSAWLCACSSASNTPPPPIAHSMIQRWCDAHPCGWDAPEGAIARVGSWHPNDYAVELVTDDALLSQLNETIDSQQARCLAFTLVADIADDAKVYLELDFLDDGIIDFQQQIPASHWQVRTFKISTPTWYRGVRYILRKESPGHAVVAELNAEVAQGCTAPPVPLLERPDGANCDGDDECRGGHCRDEVCSTCSAAQAGGTCD